MSNQKLADKLISMAKADQAMRTKAIKDMCLWDESLDKKHTSEMKRLVQRYG